MFYLANDQEPPLLNKVAYEQIESERNGGGQVEMPEKPSARG